MNLAKRNARWHAPDLPMDGKVHAAVALARPVTSHDWLAKGLSI
ncbi:hypothetical protein [Paraburkholderia ribeironis]|nr:hypothetical protein [Paraburkholderia ribeironis]